MYVNLDHSDGQYCIRRIQEEKPADYDRDSNWVSVQPQVIRAWQALQDQLTVFDSLFTQLENQRWDEVKSR